MRKVFLPLVLILLFLTSGGCLGARLMVMPLKDKAPYVSSLLSLLEGAKVSPLKNVEVFIVDTKDAESVKRALRGYAAVAEVRHFYPLCEENWGLAKIDASAFWDRGIMGQGAVVAVIDTGAVATHPELEGKIAYWKDFTGNETSPVDKDVSKFHGTHVCGIIAGKSVGVAPDAQLAVACAAEESTGEVVLPEDAVLEAMDWILELKKEGINVVAVNCSFGKGEWTQEEYEIFSQVFLKLVEGGIVPVVAAGNSGPFEESINFPACVPFSVAVGAIEADGSIAPFSSRGPVVVSGQAFVKPDMCAPGVGICSSVGEASYEEKSGTSMAAPFVSGAIALVASANPSLDRPAELLFPLVAFCEDAGDPGKDNTFGFGNLLLSRVAERVLDTTKVRFYVKRGGELFPVTEIVLEGFPAFERSTSGVCLDLPKVRFLVEGRAKTDEGTVDFGPAIVDLEGAGNVATVEISLDLSATIELMPCERFVPWEGPLRILVRNAQGADRAICWVEGEGILVSLGGKEIVGGMAEFMWDGTDEGGNSAPEGEYIVKVLLVVGASSMGVLKREFYLEYGKLSIVDVYVCPHPFDSARRTLKVYVKVTRPVHSVKVEVYTLYGAPVFEGRANVEISPPGGMVKFCGVCFKPGLYVMRVCVEGKEGRASKLLRFYVR